MIEEARGFVPPKAGLGPRRPGHAVSALTGRVFMTHETILILILIQRTSQVPRVKLCIHPEGKLSLG